MSTQVIRGSILNPRPDGRVEFLPFGEIRTDESGVITAVQNLPNRHADSISDLILPPFFDNHIHIPQHPIRGRFVEGIEGDPPGGRLLAGLNRNVFPIEAKAADEIWTRQTIEHFRVDTLAHGVIGGSAYMTVHARATELALELLPETWFVGLVLMNQNCPQYLRVNEATLDDDVAHLARRFGPRMILTDRFAVTVSSPLRRRAVELAQRHGLRMQTHLAEQLSEVQLIKQVYPDAASYTDVYAQDGLLDRFPLLAHCVRMSSDEFNLLRDHGASIVHCPISNTLLGSGIMPLDEVLDRKIDYALCTDVGASPTTSILTEMVQFLLVHAGRSNRATPSEALFRSTLAPAKMLGLDHQFGSFDVGKPLSYIQVQPSQPIDRSANADKIIRDALLDVSATQIDAQDLQKLERDGLSTDPALHRLTQAVHFTASRLDEKVRKVVVFNKILFDPPPMA